MATKTKTSPKGILVWPKLNKPDFKFDPAGTFSAKLKVTGSAASKFKAYVDELHAQAFAEAKQVKGKAAKQSPYLPYEMETDEDGNETGAVVFKFKRKFKGENKTTGETWENNIKLFDAKGHRTNVTVGGGSTAILSFMPRTYNSPGVGAGVSLVLYAAQIIELVQPGSADDYGFEAQDGWEDDGSAQKAGETFTDETGWEDESSAEEETSGSTPANAINF